MRKQHRNHQGYGQIGVGGPQSPPRRNYEMHRISYALAHPDWDGQMSVLHACDNPPCVRPDHLFLGTQADNLADMTTKGRRVQYDRHGERHPRVKLSQGQVDEIRVLYAAGGVSQEALGRRFGVGQTQISRIVRRTEWTE